MRTLVGLAELAAAASSLMIGNSNPMGTHRFELPKDQPPMLSSQRSWSAAAENVGRA